MPAIVDTEVKGKALIDPEGRKPTIVISQRAMLDCGCAVFVGHRLDNTELAAASFPCNRSHSETVMMSFDQALMRSIEFPRPDPLIDVVVELLTEAEAKHA